MGVQQDLEFELAELVTVLGLPTPVSDQDRKIFWFEHRRSDGIEITLSLSVYERKVGVIVELERDRASSGVHLTECSSVRVLDSDRKIIEVVSETRAVRCVLAVEANTILDLSA
jgi:hypothetical protein